MKNSQTKILFLSFGLSLLFHLFLIANSGSIVIDLKPITLNRSQERPELRDIKVEMLDPQVLQEIVERHDKKERDPSENLVESASQEKIVAETEAVSRTVQTDLEVPEVNFKDSLDWQESSDIPMAPLVDVLAVEEGAAEGSPIINPEGRQVVTDEIPPFAVVGPVLAGPIEFPGSAEISEPLPPIEEPIAEPSVIEIPEIEVPELVTPVEEEVESFDDMVSVKMSIYPEATGGGFFRLDIQPTLEMDRLREIPKDVIFLVDSSGSISRRKFRQFREGVLRVIDYLNPSDRVNMVTFSSGPNQLFRDCVPLTEGNKEMMRKFISKVSYGGMTDVFRSLSPYVSLARKDTERPLLIFMLTDGVTTVSGKKSTEQFIREIVQMNRRNVAIYSFSAGKGVDQTLVQFLAYHNRGLAVHEAKENLFSDKLTSFITQNTELVLADLKLGTLQEYFSANLYPQKLPHLFRKNCYQVWGRYRNTDKEIILSLIGRDAEGKYKELIFRRSFETAQKGDASIKEKWIWQKLYHLKGQMLIDEANREAYLRESDALRREFGIKEISF